MIGHRVVGRVVKSNSTEKRSVIRGFDGNMYTFDNSSILNIQINMNNIYVTFLLEENPSGKELEATGINIIDKYMLMPEIWKWCLINSVRSQMIDFSAFVYVLEMNKDNDAKKYKIGQSVNPTRRAKDERKKRQARIYEIHRICNNNSKLLELKLHDIYRSKTCGPSAEWFRLVDEDINWLLSLQNIDMDHFMKLNEELWDILMEEDEQLYNILLAETCIWGYGFHY